MKRGVNYLAHFALAEADGAGLLGGLIGDFVKGDLAGKFDWPIEREARLHRKIDAWTGDDPFCRQAKSCFPQAHRRVAPILLDLYWDHLLIRRWDQLMAPPLRAFAEECYGLMRAHRAVMPASLAQLAPRMTAHDFLFACATPEGLNTSAERLAARWRHGALLRAAAPALATLPQVLDDGFCDFFSRLRGKTRAARAALEAERSA